MSAEKSTYTDPVWQKLLYIYLDPIFRVLHGDSYNISIVALVLVTWYNISNVYGILFGILVFLLALVKFVLVGGICTTVYKQDRHYNNSVLKANAPSMPKLYLNGKTAYANGYSQGVLLCNEIIHLINRFKLIVRPKVSHWKLKRVNDSLPPTIKSELTGMYDAINEAKPGALTYFDLLMMQMIPELDQMGCTCYAVKESGTIVFGRNMDWLPMNSAQYSIIVEYENHDYCSLTLPGLIGCVTAWNNKFVIAMNVVGGKHTWNIDGLPSMLCNKMLMITKKSVKSAHSHALNVISPNCPYHLTIAEENDVICYSYNTNAPMYKPVKRRLSDSPTDTLAVLNWTYPENNNGRYFSAYRNEKTKGTDVISVLRACQSFSTIHSMIFKPKYGSFVIAADNGYAADLLSCN
jgi:hypothetical protein